MALKLEIHEKSRISLSGFLTKYVLPFERGEREMLQNCLLGFKKNNLKRGKNACFKKQRQKKKFQKILSQNFF